jgi:ribosomal protein S18 acetylase RimI-like enzyme
MLTFQFLKTPACDQIKAIICLYQEAKWWSAGIDDQDLIKAIVAGSHCFCVATTNNKIVAMGRAISDGASDAYIQDVVVSKAFRHQGIATQIITRLIEKLEADGIGWIGLIAENNTTAFYHRFGFTPMENAISMLRLRKL